MTAVTEQSTGTLANFLALLPDGHYALCHEPVGGAFTAERVPLLDVEAAVDSLPDCSTWLSIAQVEPVGPGRGGKADVRRLVALPNDFDIKPGAFTEPQTALQAIVDLSAVLGTRPAVIVHTGHGLQAWWLLDADDDLWACDGPDDPRWLDIVVLVERRWQRLVRSVCAQRGAAMDNVFDVSRVMRLPFTVNTKDPAAPVDSKVLWRNDAHTPLSYNDVADRLDDAGVPELDRDRDVSTDVVAPAADWPWAESTCRYARTVVDGLDADTPGERGRHPWLLGKATRLAALHRYGCLTEADYRLACERLRARFLTVITDPRYGTPRPKHLGEVTDALTFGVSKVESWTDAGVRTELANRAGDLHDHDGFGDFVDDATARLPDGQGAPQSEPEPAGPSTRQEDAVFGATPELAYIRALARERMVSPWALLSGCLALVIATTHPDVHSPAFVGGKGSLNLGVAVAGPSGSGKSAAMSVALEVLTHALRHSGADYMNPSSGEGILAMFVKVDSKGVQTQARERVVSLVDEIATLAAQSSRQGSTLMSMLRTAISGHLLSTHGAEGSRQRRLEPHTYRWCLLVGVQPGTARYFLDEKDEGTPQRFLWIPSTDPAADKDAPAAGPSVFADWRLGPHTDTITFPDGVRDIVRQANEDRGRGRGDALDGHAMLTRIKVAAGLALLHRTTTVSDALWEVSGHVMAVSDRTRRGLLDHAAREAVQAAKRLGRVTAARDEARDQAKVEQCALVLARRVWKATVPVTRRQVKDSAGRYKDVWTDALDLAVGRDWVRAVEVAGTSQTGHQYGPGGVRP
jgi:hypothetical protein